VLGHDRMVDERLDTVTRLSISVVVPMYDCARDIDRCIASVLAQTRRPDRVILVDDGCTDDTPELAVAALECGDLEYELIRHQNNRGAGAARNTGLGAVREDLVWFLDSDDYAAESFLEVLTDALGDAAFAECRTLRVSHDGLALGVDEPVFGRERVSGTEHARMLLTGRARAYPPTKVFRRSVLGTAPWDEGRCYEDAVPVLRMSLASAAVALVDEPLYRYRTRPGSASTTFGAPTLDLFDVSTEVAMLVRSVSGAEIDESDLLRFELHEIIFPVVHMAMRARHGGRADGPTDELAAEAIRRARGRLRLRTVYATVRSGRWRDVVTMSMLKMCPALYAFVLRYR